MVFEREMDICYANMMDEIDKLIRERLRQGEYEETEGRYVDWRQGVPIVWWAMRKKISKIGRVWSETEKDLFFSQLRADLEKRYHKLIVGE